MIPGENRTFILQIGDRLLVDALSGSASVVTVASGVEPTSPVAVSSATRMFGPFNEIRAFRVSATAGIFVDASIINSGQVYQRPYETVITSRAPLTIVIPAGSTLDVATANGTGFYTPADAFTPVIYFNGSTISIGPFKEVRRFTFYVLTGTAVAVTAWDNDPEVIAPNSGMLRFDNPNNFINLMLFL